MINNALALNFVAAFLKSNYQNSLNELVIDRRMWLHMLVAIQNVEWLNVSNVERLNLQLKWFLYLDFNNNTYTHGK